MSTQSSSGQSGIGFFGLLAILFIALKLTGFIDWPWWVVLSPIWGSIVVVVLIIAGLLWLAFRKETK